MTNEERDALIQEMHTDVKWIKETLTGHLKNHVTWAVAIVGVVATLAAAWTAIKH
jgi:hypothetical protein